MENVKEQNIGEFVEAVNGNENLKHALDEAVKDALPKKYFENLDAFVSFLPNTIKNFFDKKNLEKLGTEWKSFETKNIQDKDLEALYEINLNPKTKTEIIRGFIYGKNKKKMKSKDQKDVQRAFDTFKKILNKDNVSVSIFYLFVIGNIGARTLEKNNLDTIIPYVRSVDEGDKLYYWRFWLLCSRFKEQPSQDFVNFIVENTDFNKLDDQYLICNIIILTLRYPKDKEDEKKDNTVEALENILGGQGIYKKFSEALAKVQDIGKKIELGNMEKIESDIVRGFAKKLRDNSIEIKFENNSFAVKTKKTTEVSWLKIGFGTVLMLLGIVMFASLFLAPGIVIPFLANLLSISTFTAKIALAVIGFGLAVVGGMLSVRGIINNIMYKNSPGNGQGGGRLIKMLNEQKRTPITDDRFNQRGNLSRNTINKNKNETTI